MKYHQAVWSEPLLKELSRKGRRAYSLPELDERVRDSMGDIYHELPESMLRDSPPNLPELSEPEIVRHFVRLSQMNFAIDLGMYPLGSCTMKYNPKVSQRIARNPKMANLHPYQDESTVQGTLEILFELGEILSEIAGMDRFSLAPAAGAQGEYVGALIIRNYLRDNKFTGKDEMLVPDSAHGTNPASAAMAGFKVVKIPSSDDGIVTAEAVVSKITDRTAGMMLTVPSTLGIFEREIVEVAKIIHEENGLMYYDGANMNALLGRVRPGDMGFDVIHINVHKTFATPHGGGGPGAGPVGVKAELQDYLPVPLISKTGDSYHLDYKSSKSIGFIKSFYGNSAVLLRAYCYILSLGKEGLKTVSEQAVLASNYLLSLLDGDSYSTPYSPKTPRKHEFVVSSSPLKKRYGVSAGDVAKTILDHGMHSPTIYFPLIVAEALMIEPTESEPLENLESYAQVLNEIAKLAAVEKESVLASPKNTSIGRLDEYKASHPNTMILNWNSVPASRNQS
ncbi:MAG: aminomethyl-transferring glycine dehydrogenase subunit GcvPB [Thaumarchaeota archaeon]|nr:aminomethyl-transferring glycine dehydrogenase subunit GcvPB [Nitrososphaerota archaeon]